MDTLAARVGLAELRLALLLEEHVVGLADRALESVRGRD